jgi:phosphate transport system permease protein
LVVAPWVRTIIEPALAHITGGRGPFGGSQLGVGLLLAGLILSIMILPTMVAISRDVLLAVPGVEIEGAFALGATRWQVMRRVVVPSARGGILGATTLATGRAMGETIAVTMVIGNTDHFTHSFFGTTQTMASLIANEFTEATEPFHLAALIGVGVLLLVVAVIVNLAARLLVRSIGRQRAVGIGVL